MSKYEKSSIMAGKNLNETTRSMPNDAKMEQCILSCIIEGSEELKNKLLTALKSEDFYNEANRQIFDTLYKMYTNNIPIEFVTLYDSLTKDNVIEKVGGIDYLSYIRGCIPSTANYNAYFNSVKRDSVLRKVILMCQDITNFAIECGDKDKCLEYAEKSIFDLAQEEEKSDFIHIKDATNAVYKKFMNIFKNKGLVKGLEVGYYGLDKLTNGFQESDLILLAARPSVGKTSFAMNIVDNVAKAGKKVAVFSLEMGAEQLAQRMLCSDSAVSMSKVLQGDITPYEINKIYNETKEVENKAIYIYDNSNVTAADVRARCTELKKKVGLDLIMIDYLQLMSSPTRSSGSEVGRQQEIAEITRNLKITCRELKVPILLLSQLSRAVEQRQGHRPQLSDLRESGAIEQDADIVMFLHNPSRYEDTKKNMDDQAKKRADNGNFDVELIVAKHRNGALGTIKLTFRSENTTFISVNSDRNAESLDRTAPPPMQHSED